MAEKDTFIKTLEQEFQTTLKVLKAYPVDKLDLRPSDRSRTAKELAWTFVIEEIMLMGGIIKGQIDTTMRLQMPASYPEILTALEQTHRQNLEQLKKMTEAEINSTMKFFVSPKTIGDVRRGDLLWMTLHDSIHHRGQFSVYLRMAGGKVPSIYGPTADEPWM